MGTTCSWPTGATDAIALVESRGGGVDLLLTDVIMPRMSGGDVATALRQRLPDLGVLFMSGYTETHRAERRAGVGLHFLAKPFTPAELLARVREVLASRAAHGGPMSSAEPVDPHPTPPSARDAWWWPTTNPDCACSWSRR